MLKNEWMKDPQLKVWSSTSCVDKPVCSCKTDTNYVELWEHDSCTIGRIDTTICTKCQSVVKFSIIK